MLGSTGFSEDGVGGRPVLLTQCGISALSWVGCHPTGLWDCPGIRPGPIPASPHKSISTDASHHNPPTTLGMLVDWECLWVPQMG